MWILTLILVNLFIVDSQKSFSDVKNALENNVVFHFENGVSLRPVAQNSELITVNIDFNIASVNDFNEQNGYIEISGYVIMDWTMTEGTTESDSFEEMVANTLIWKPPIILVNAIKLAEEIGWDSNVDVRFNFNTLHCSWRPWIIARAACTPDVKYYPFDKQTCSFKFAAWGYNSSEMLLVGNSSVVNFNFFEENGEWTIDESSLSSSIENDASVAEYKIKLTRRPTYYVINLIAPIILLDVLNVFVFILPPASGERIGYAITCFLSYVVLLNTIMAFLPTSAAPLAYLSYYTFIMMCFSAGMSLATIITIRVHLKPKDEPVSPSVQKFWDCLCCKWLTVTDSVSTTRVKPVQNGNEPTFQNVPNKIVPNVEERVPTVTMISWDDNDPDEVVDQSEHPRVPTAPPELMNADNNKDTEKSDNNTWEKLAFYLDMIFFLGFLAGQIFYSVAYLIPIIVNA